METELHRQRLGAVLDAVRECHARTVLDLGCGDGAFLVRLAREPHIERVVGVEPSAPALQTLRNRLHEEPPQIAAKVTLLQGSMTEPDRALAGFDAAVLLEVIEHVAPERLSVVERAVFRDLGPKSVVITTPNADFNPLLGVPRHRFRHPDHRFEWGREKFRSWAAGVARRNGYQVAFADLAGAHPTCGGATQMALFQHPR